MLQEIETPVPVPCTSPLQAQPAPISDQIEKWSPYLVQMQRRTVASAVPARPQTSQSSAASRSSRDDVFRRPSTAHAKQLPDSDEGPVRPRKPHNSKQRLAKTAWDPSPITHPIADGARPSTRSERHGPAVIDHGVLDHKEQIARRLWERAERIAARTAQELERKSRTSALPTHLYAGSPPSSEPNESGNTGISSGSGSNPVPLTPPASTGFGQSRSSPYVFSKPANVAAPRGGADGSTHSATWASGLQTISATSPPNESSPRVASSGPQGGPTRIVESTSLECEAKAFLSPLQNGSLSLLPGRGGAASTTPHVGAVRQNPRPPLTSGTGLSPGNMFFENARGLWLEPDSDGECTRPGEATREVASLNIYTPRVFGVEL